MVTEGVEPSTVALLAQRSNQLSYATSSDTINLKSYKYNQVTVWSASFTNFPQKISKKYKYYIYTIKSTCPNWLFWTISPN